MDYSSKMEIYGSFLKNCTRYLRVIKSDRRGNHESIKGLVRIT